MATVAIIGAGDIGAATALALASAHRVGRIVLVDPAGSAAAGKALDIQQSGAVAPFDARLDGTDDESRIAGCAACVVADRFGGTEWCGEPALAMLVRIAPYLAGAPMIFAGTSHADVMNMAATEAEIAPERMIGSSPEALRSAITAIVAMEAGCSPRDVALTVLGVPPTAFVVPWSEATIGGYALERAVSQVQLTRLRSRAQRLWPPGPYALGAAAAHVTAAVLSSSRQFLTVLTRLDGEFGVKGRTGILPSRLGTRGIVETRVPDLGSRERVQLLTALGG
jgi:malate/lactate dehydrogenase